MVNAEELKRYIKISQERELPDVKPREVRPENLRGKATAIIGPRRVGKTYLLYWMMKSNGDRDKSVYLNFENPLLYDMRGEDFPMLVDAYFDLYPENVGKNVHFLLDEIQNVSGWEIGVRYLLDEGFYVSITGSSSKLLGEEISSQMRGRTLRYVLLPLSFREFLSFRGYSVSTQDVYGRMRHKIKSLFSEYMRFGGYPEVVLMEEKIRILEDYLSTIVRKDIMERYQIRNPDFMDALIKYLLTNYSKYASYSSIYRTFKPIYGISKKTVIEYMRYLQNSFFIFLLRKYARSPKEVMRAPSKIYLVDTGFGLFSKKSTARDLENIVFLELLRRKYYEKPLLEIYYWSDGKGEVDFVIKKGENVEELIQVTYSLENIERREIEALIRASSELKCSRRTVLTMEENSGEKTIGKINVEPVWAWLLK